jgi:hypothetical protein
MRRDGHLRVGPRGPRTIRKFQPFYLGMKNGEARCRAVSLKDDLEARHRRNVLPQGRDKRCSVELQMPGRPGR